MPPRLTLAVCHAEAAKHKGTCLSTKYVNTETKMLWECGAGLKHKPFPMTLQHVRAGQWCPNCGNISKSKNNPSRLDLSVAHAEAAKHGGTCLSTEYDNTETKMLWKCGAGLKHEPFPMTLGHVRAGHWCPDCGDIGKSKNNPLRLELSVAQAEAEKHDGQCLSTVYVSSRADMIWQCAIKEHPPFENAFQHIRQGVWCPKCGDIERRINNPLIFTLDDAQAEAEKHGGQCLSTEYVNARTPLLWGCGKGLKHPDWLATLGSVRSGTWCPACGSDKKVRESKCRQVVESYLGPASEIRFPKFLITDDTPRGLELDIYYPHLGFAIEVQGDHHRRRNPFFQRTEEAFQLQLSHDRLKRNLCCSHWVALEEIWEDDGAPEEAVSRILHNLGLID